MTKSAKHKKEFRKEKNKIKLKLTARATRPKIGKNKKTISHKTQFLPKGLNVTDTSFKSRKIVLPDNLRPDEDSGIPLTKRKQTFKELLSHMGHFSSTIQQDGVNGIKELLTKFPELAEMNLASLFGKLSELVSAGDAGVRKCSLKLLDHILEIVPHEKITPFYPLLNAQLMCSMNHIALDIQKDSHLMLDILLNRIPELVATTAVQILPNFLDQISCRDDSKGGKRILAINPAQRLTSLKWRQEVLMRVHRLLDLLLPNRGISDDSAPLTVFDPDGPCLYPLYHRRDFRLKLNIQAPGHRICSNHESSSSHPLHDFITHLIPLLMETWIEALAAEQLDKNQGGSLIGSESHMLLSCSISVLLTLRSVLERLDEEEKRGAELMASFEQQVGESLLRHFIQRFPFSVRVESRRNSVGRIDPHCREQNLALCFLWAQLGGLKSAAKFAPLIFQYLSGIFETADHQALTPPELNHIKTILLVSSSARAKKSYQSLSDGLVRSATDFSRRIREDRKDRLLLNQMLMEVGESLNLELGNLPALKEWIENCPSLLRQDGNDSLLGFINRVISRNAVSRANACKEAEHLLARLAGRDCDQKAVSNFLFWTRREMAGRGTEKSIHSIS